MLARRTQSIQGSRRKRRKFIIRCCGRKSCSGTDFKHNRTELSSHINVSGVFSTVKWQVTENRNYGGDSSPSTSSAKDTKPTEKSSATSDVASATGKFQSVITSNVLLIVYTNFCGITQW
jgi:hypothetical protein